MHRTRARVSRVSIKYSPRVCTPVTLLSVTWHLQLSGFSFCILSIWARRVTLALAAWVGRRGVSRVKWVPVLQVVGDPECPGPSSPPAQGCPRRCRPCVSGAPGLCRAARLESRGQWSSCCNQDSHHGPCTCLAARGHGPPILPAHALGGGQGGSPMGRSQSPLPLQCELGLSSPAWWRGSGRALCAAGCAMWSPVPTGHTEQRPPAVLSPGPLHPTRQQSATSACI